MKVQEVEKNLKWLFFESEIPPKEIQEATGFPSSNISSIRNGRRNIENLSWKTIKKLCNFINSSHNKYRKDV